MSTRFPGDSRLSPRSKPGGGKDAPDGADSRSGTGVLDVSPGEGCETGIQPAAGSSEQDGRNPVGSFYSLTDDVRLAAVNAALWLREEVQARGFASLTATFRGGLTVIYRHGGATVLLEGAKPVNVSDDDLDGERFAVVA